MRSNVLAVPFIVASLILPWGAGCSSASSTASSAGGEVFIPQASDFDNYRSWTTFTEDAAPPDSVTTDAGASVHTGGQRIEYLNQKPPHGATEFPVGTIIVKEIPAQQQVFAMVKRGGDYNPYDAGTGAPAYSSWEWFELTGTAAAPQVLWDGLPPQNQAYSGSDPYVCNQCHFAMAPHNDFVASPAIRLESF